MASLVAAVDQVINETVTQMNTFLSYVAALGDPNVKDENKFKAALELSEKFEVIISHPQYPVFLENALKLFLSILQDGKPQFIVEHGMQQVRKLILEMIHRLPTNEVLRPYVKSILSLMFRLLEKENEENVLVCLRIIIELQKKFRPQFNQEIQTFLNFVKSIYKEVPNHLQKIFEPRAPIIVSNLSEVDIESLLKETFSITVIKCEKRTEDGVQAQLYNLIPKATLSLKVLQELPIIVVLMYQLYKQQDVVHRDVEDFIPLIMTIITLQPSQAQRQGANFNKEIFVDFIGAQVKTLSFLAYIIKIYQDEVTQHAKHMVTGMLSLLTNCPMEVAHYRKELLVAARHILATDLRIKFVPYINHLFDENILLGKGWTTHESLRPVAYSTLADLVHHVRKHLQLADLTKAVHFFSKNVHDESLPTNIQTVSCKLLSNLVESIKLKSDTENYQGRELLLKMLEVFVLKFKTIAKLQLPYLIGKCKQPTQATGNTNSLNAGNPPILKTATANPGFPTQFNPLVNILPDASQNQASGATASPLAVADTSKGSTQGDPVKEEKSRFGFPTAPSSNYSVADCRVLVKSLVNGIKTVTGGLALCKSSSGDGKQFQPKETLIFIRLVKYAMQALDIYTVSLNPMLQGIVAPAGQRNSSSQLVRSIEEKDVLENFAHAFFFMDPQTFQEIFSVTIDYLVDRIHKNLVLQVVVVSFLNNETTSPVFASVLIEYLLERMEEVGSSAEKSNLYFKLFKLVFGSITKFPEQNKHMLRPHLHKIVIRSLELAMTAKEPCNYFLLLRALFRSMGGGTHDLLYKEFLPLLSNLLQGLNSLQSGLHKQQMKDLFVELCLTVPVRLSALLPYLPMLMDPFVYALNGSQSLTRQGLRTLELCVDNIQPDFLYEHIQPVRADLMQALWSNLRNPANEVAPDAFRVLGKFGGGNRKMMIEPQRLNYDTRNSPGPCIIVHFIDQGKPINFPVSKVVETAYNNLNSCSTEPYYRKQSWEIIRCYLVAAINVSHEKEEVQQFFSHHSFADQSSQIASYPGIPYKSAEKEARATLQNAVTAMLVAAAIRELRQSVTPTMMFVVTHFTMVAIAQQAGPFPLTLKPSIQGMDPLILVDALTVIMGHQEKELCKAGHLALAMILETATNILGSKQKACRLPFMEYLAERMCSLCYERAWYSKLGGCLAIKFFFERMDQRWVFEHLFQFLKALLFLMMDLTGEISSGAIDMAKVNLEKMLNVYALPYDKDEVLIQCRTKSLLDVTSELVRQVTSPNTLVREQAMHSLEVLAKAQNITVTEVMEPHKTVLKDMIPPEKHILRKQSVNTKIGLMDGIMVCSTLEPRLFTINLDLPHHEQFFQDLMNLCEADDAQLAKQPCYKSVSSFTPLRKAAYRALAACHYIVSCREKIFSVLYKALEKSDPELQEAAFQCMKKFVSGFSIDLDIVRTEMRPFLLTLGDYCSLSINGAQRLSYLTQLFPACFNEIFCEQLMQHLKNLMDLTIIYNKGIDTGQKTLFLENERKISIIISIFHQVSAASSKFIEVLSQLVLQTEKALMREASSNFREPLMKFLLKYPEETIDLLLSDHIVKEQQWSRLLEFMIKHKDGKPFRDVLQNKSLRLITMVSGLSHQSAEKTELQYVSIRITSILIKFDDHWLSTQHQLVQAYKTLWTDDKYLDAHKKVENVEYCHWREPKLLVKILLHYFCHHPNNIDLLFQLLRALCDRFIPDFQFLRDFLENTVSLNYTIEWKRSAFFRFIDFFQTGELSQDVMAKVLQMVLIPCFAVSFERGEGEKLIGSPAAPNQENPDNIVSVFISKVIEPKNAYTDSDSVRIFVLQFSCLLVEQASLHIHNPAFKRGPVTKAQSLMTFAWPCLFVKTCVDPATRYHGHLLLCHLIANFAMKKKVKLQVFHSLLKAHAIEARNVVRQALDILTPLIAVKMEQGYTMLTHWTKKIIVEEGYSMQQLFHILQLVVRHYKVYYPVRHHLVQHMVNSMQRLGFSPTATFEHRKLAVELSEVIIKWDLQRIKDENEQFSSSKPGMKRSSTEDSSVESARKRHAGTSGPATQPGPIAEIEPDYSTPIDRIFCDAVLNFLLRLACQVNDNSTTVGPQGELLSRRCVSLLKTALKQDVWPYTSELKLMFLENIFSSIGTPAPNFGNICTAFELLTYLLGIMGHDQILTSIKPLQKSIVACMASNNNKVIHLVHTLMARLMSIFPTESTTASVASKYEELEILYSSLGKHVIDALTAYEKQEPTSAMLYGPLMMLKAACMNNQQYIDRLITPFMRVLQKMTREHLNGIIQQGSVSTATDLLILSIDMVKNRVAVMGEDMRKTFIGTILVGLVEKSPDIKVLKAIAKMLEDWIKTKSLIGINQTPSMREKSILLVKMMQYVEKRFPNDLELNAQFLEIVNFIYRDDLKNTELGAKLEPAFLAGLRCVQPAIRAKFFEVFDNSMKRRIHDRLLYIIISQNWEPMGPHYWIKQCIELLIVTSQPGYPIRLADSNHQLPPINYGMNLADAAEKATFLISLMDRENREGREDACESSDTVDSIHDKDGELDLEQIVRGVEPKEGEESRKNRKQALNQSLLKQQKYLESVRETYDTQFLQATAQLCHMDKALAERVWLDLFPRIWSILTDQQQNAIISEVVPFISSGAHVIQKDCHPSALNTFIEAFSQCVPILPIKPSLMKYIGKSHNLWHRMTMNLEQLAVENSSQLHPKSKRDVADCYDFEQNSSAYQWQEILDSLSEMYSLLCEEDMWAGLWQKHSRYRETSIAIAYEQQGFFEQAKNTYELAMTKVRTDFSNTPHPSTMNSEMGVWETHWTRCCKELNQWDLLLSYASDKSTYNPFLILETAWRVPEWSLTKEAIQQIEHACPKDLAWKLHLYRGYLAVCHSVETHVDMVDNVGRHIEGLSALCIREWKRLPHIVSHIHLPLLQAAQQIMELHEAAQIHQSIIHGCNKSMYEMKAILKTWRNRLPVIADDLSHWSDIFTWRQHHYTYIMNHSDGQQDASILGVHSSTQAIIHFGKIARKHNLPSVCLDTLARIYTIPNVPISSRFQDIRQQVKCYLQRATVKGKSELKEGLDALESVNLEIFSKNKEMLAEFLALKGMLLAHLGRADEANKSFSAAVQLHDSLLKAWTYWGDYLEQLFIRDPTNITIGMCAVSCFLQACRQQNEAKSRKNLAKVLWLITYDDKNSILTETIDRYSIGVPPIHWLPWIPQLLTCLIRHEGDLIPNLLIQVGRIFPEAVYLPIRTLFLTLKIKQRFECYKPAEPGREPTTPGSDPSDDVQQTSNSSADQNSALTDPTIPATKSMVRCSRIFHKLRDVRPTVLSSLEGILAQIVCFHENWYEEVLRLLRQGLAKCLAIAFENRATVKEATITPHTINFVKKLVSTFIDLKMERQTSSVRAACISAASESLASRARDTVQDPVFQQLRAQFTTDFEFLDGESNKLHNLIQKFRKWISILESKMVTLPKSFLMEEKCRFLSNFSLQTAEVQLPGEFLLPKHSHYYVRIARFMPNVDIVQKHNSAARRLYIRGHNGKIYPYLVVTDSGLGDARREERVLQLLRMLNHYLGKRKETSRRFLNFTVPRVVAFYPQMRLIEDNPASLSLLDIYKQHCQRVKIEHDDAIATYYDRLAAVQARGSQASVQVLREIFQDVQNTVVPRRLIHKWAVRTFPGATDFWTFRKVFTLQFSLACLSEYVFHLTRLNPGMMYLHQDSGLVNISYFKFEINDVSGELDGNRPVPFRLTPNIVDFITAIGINGPLTASMIAVARCLVQPTFKVQTLLRAILRDEMISAHKKKQDDGHHEYKNSPQQDMLQGEDLIPIVIHAVSCIMSRLNTLSSFDGIESKVSNLVTAALDHNNLCRMDPAWHPWL